MKVGYSKSDFLKATLDVLVVPVYKDWKKSAAVQSLDKALDGELLKRAKKAGYEGAADSRLVLQTFWKLGIDRVVLAGMGKRETPTPEKLWDLSHGVCSGFRSPAVKTVGLVLDFEKGLDGGVVVEKLALGALSGVYAFDKYKAEAQKKNKKTLPASLTIFGFGADAPSPALGKRAAQRGEILATAVNAARDLVNEPAETMTPQIYAAEAKRWGKSAGFSVKVETEAQIRRRKMGLFLAVARGSKNPPVLVTMTHDPAGAKGKPIVLVGKGLMYDSGGYSLKPSASMETMKCDMSGSAAVLGAMIALAKLGVKKKVIGVVAACENMIGGGAYRVGDIFTGMNGKTVEVLNTDAEGRLTLADALTYADGFKPDFVVDLATLTGACVVALGEETTGVFSPDDAFAESVLGAFHRAGEDGWRLPLNPRLKKLIKSKIADLKNVGGRWGGAITAGLFLQEFTNAKRWAHLDIAGPAFHGSASGHMPAGGSGVGVATLVELIDPSGK